MSEPKKQSFLHGTMLLAMSTAIVKVIGAFYSIPLNAIIGEQGFGYYSTAYEIYTVLLMISTAGLPVAMSRMVSAASSLGHYRQVRKIYTVARTIFLTLGLLGALLMTVFCKQLAVFQEQPDAWAAIAALGPSCFLICLMSTYRGFFQGQSNMMPTSVSQVIEAIVKLVVGLSAAVLILWYTQNDYSLAAGGAIAGVTLSCLVSSVYLNRCFRKAFRDMPKTAEDTDDGKTIAKTLLAIAIPITISVIPAITAQLTRGEHKAVRATEESAARVTALISAPCAVGIAVLAQPVTGLLGGYTGEKLALATQLMAVLGICIVFNATVLLTNAIMQAHGHVNLPVINMFVGGIVKLLAIAVLTGNPHIGILGTPIGSLLCYICITVLNLVTIRRVIPEAPAIAKNLLKAIVAAAVMGVFVWGAWFGLSSIGITSRVILCGLPIAVGVAVYAVAAVKLRAITREDCLLLPKGEKIAKLLHL